MCCHVRSASTSALRRRKNLLSALRQMRLLARLSRRGLRIAPSCAPAKPSGASDGQGAR